MQENSYFHAFHIEINRNNLFQTLDLWSGKIYIKLYEYDKDLELLSNLKKDPKLSYKTLQSWSSK